MSMSVIKQRSDYTFKFNKDLGRHGWLRLTPAYSVKLVEKILKRMSGKLVVFDPFSGTGTTQLCSCYYGHSSIGYELNPFLMWLSTAKVRKYPKEVIEDSKESLTYIIKRLRSQNQCRCIPPPIYNIKRWWSEERLDFLCRLMWCIRETCHRFSMKEDLFLIAFCRVMIDLSNASFNHQSLSFKDVESKKSPELFSIEPDYTLIFKKEMTQILKTAELNPSGEARILKGDSRNLIGLDKYKFNFLITSPPYPNRMSYIRELRPYMYWLNYLKEHIALG